MKKKLITFNQKYLNQHASWVHQRMKQRGTALLFEYEGQGAGLTPGAAEALDKEVAATRDRERLPGKEGTQGQSPSKDFIIESLKQALATGAWDLTAGEGLMNSNTAAVQASVGRVRSKYSLPSSSIDVVVEAQFILDATPGPNKARAHIMLEEEFSA